ncbi:MAG: hypothetical protein CMF61_04610 [Magnetococcales bacterium]|nr:hypothetical protein [Magnetococcales bacterium]PPR16095.1 MAG: hypothetical protein CFH43_00835 [Pseudomonadota bacterium]|tara:strand:- start:454 stop:864 length:411 start_codon:yes stop_codon:yes gene_type:complete
MNIAKILFKEPSADDYNPAIHMTDKETKIFPFYLLAMAIFQTIFQLTGLSEQTFWYATTEAIIVAYIVTKSGYIGRLIHGKDALLTTALTTVPYLIALTITSLFMDSTFCELTALAVFTYFYYRKFKAMKNSTPEQ